MAKPESAGERNIEQRSEGAADAGPLQRQAAELLTDRGSTAMHKDMTAAGGKDAAAVLDPADNPVTIGGDGKTGAAGTEEKTTVSKVVEDNWNNPYVPTVGVDRMSVKEVGRQTELTAKAGDKEPGDSRLLAGSADLSLDNSLAALAGGGGARNVSAQGNDLLSFLAGAAQGQNMTAADRLALQLGAEVVKGVGNLFEKAWTGFPEDAEANRAAEAEAARVRAEQEAEQARQEAERARQEAERARYQG